MMTMAVYSSVKLVTGDGSDSVCSVKLLVPGDGYSSVWQCKASYRGWLWQFMPV